MNSTFLRNAVRTPLIFLWLLLISSSASAAQLRLAWDANTESDLAGYKVYYGTGSGTYGSPINVGKVTTCTLNSLTPGQTYYIAVTAYDTSDNESGYSTEVRGIPTDTMSLSLKAGWNLISFPTLSQSTPVTDMLSSISGQYAKAYTYRGCDTGDPWKIYDPVLPPYANDLQYVDRTTGIWINMTRDAEIHIPRSFSSSTNIPLCVGSNLVSYTGNQAKPVAEALSSISGKYEKVYVYKADAPSDPWKIYDPSLPAYANDLTTIEPGFAYWINAKENCNLIMNN